MSKTTDAALRRQILTRTLNLATVGTGRCPNCRQRTEIFSWRRATPGERKERCLDCWRAKR